MMRSTVSGIDAYVRHQPHCRVRHFRVGRRVKDAYVAGTSYDAGERATSVGGLRISDRP